MEKYSVLMSVYRKEDPAFLAQSIDSILSQTVPPEQFIIVEDGELTGELNGVIDSYAAGAPGLFTLVRLEKNSGLAVALDRGLIEARNELVARMDSDDISLPTRMEKQLMRFAEKPELALLGSDIDEFYDDPGNVVSVRAVPSDYEEIRKYIRRRDPFNHPTVMFRKSEVIRCGGYGTLRRRQDFDLFSRMVNMGCYAENIDESLLLFRSNADNYKRRKSRESTSGYIKVVKMNYKRGYCSLIDLSYVWLAQTALYLMPLGIMKWISDKYLRKKK